jgi:hypothetical protein
VAYEWPSSNLYAFTWASSIKATHDFEHVILRAPRLGFVSVNRGAGKAQFDTPTLCTVRSLHEVSNRVPVYELT